VKIKLHEEICKERTGVLEFASDQWFYGHNFEVYDYLKLMEAMNYFKQIQEALRTKLIEEGKL